VAGWWAVVLASLWFTPASPSDAPTSAPAESKGGDVLQPLAPEDVRLAGYLGARVASSVRGRLLAVDEDALLSSFERRPGKQAWIGEHAGKWLDAASLAWANARDPALRSKLDRVLSRLVAAQEVDGYLGTYPPANRFGHSEGAEWDVWVHKYDLIGLLSYWRATHDPRALAAARRAADLVLRTFAAGGKDILAAGTHAGMAATSILEPIVLLHRATGETRYLDFARRLRAALEDPGGPELLSSLVRGRPVSEIADGKAYEMISNLLGVCELARETGDRDLLRPVVAAWEDIVARRLYLTGTTSAGEHFRGDHELPNNAAACVGETCVTTSWVQLNAQLLRLTGEERYAEQLERAIYNHLLAAQRPDGTQWCIYTPLQGTKRFSAETSCCLSSGPRAIALLPELAYFKYREATQEGICVNLFERSRATLVLGGSRVTLEQATEFPRSGYSRFTVHCATPARFGMRIRVPEWAGDFLVRPPGAGSFAALPQSRRGGWYEVPPRVWRDGEVIEVRIDLDGRLIAGDPANPGRVAAMWGPLVLALEEGAAGSWSTLCATGLAGGPTAAPPSAPRATDLRIQAAVRTGGGPPRPAAMVPFAEAGADGRHYQIWLRSPRAAAAANPSLLAGGTESRSRIGGGWGEIIDGDPATYASTANGRFASEDWFAVALPAPAVIRRVVYMHGRAFPNGGWFDASAGKPRVQVVRAWGGRWEDLAPLSDYPATTGSDARGLRAGEAFTVRLPRPARVLAVRVIGRPAGGMNPRAPFASCAELQAFGE
jgi:DUF1680 family protein